MVILNRKRAELLIKEKEKSWFDNVFNLNYSRLFFVDARGKLILEQLIDLNKMLVYNDGCG